MKKFRKYFQEKDGIDIIKEFVSISSASMYTLFNSTKQKFSLIQEKDRDLFEIDRYDIQNTKPVAVFMEGEMVRGGL